MQALNLLIQSIGNLFTWFVVVAPWEQALRVRFGKNVQLLGSGFYLRVPFVDRVYRQTIRNRMFVVRPQVLTSKDGKTISLSGAVGFRVDDLLKLFNTLHDAMDTIEARIASQVAEYVATHDLPECQPLEIERHIAETVDITAFGLADQEFKLTNYAVITTYRFITGDIPAWSQGNSLNTSHYDGAP